MPASTSESPALFSFSKIFCCDGLRISQSTSRIREPFCAKESARFALVTLLPEFGSALVMTMVLSCPEDSVNSSAVRMFL